MSLVEADDGNKSTDPSDELTVLNQSSTCCRGSWFVIGAIVVFVGIVATVAFMRGGGRHTLNGARAPGLVITEGEPLLTSVDSDTASGPGAKPDTRPITDYLDDHPVAEARHPLDPPLEVARQGLTFLRSNIRDYTATVIKRERLDGDLAAPERIFAKVRHEQRSDGKITVPRSVYLKFLEPEAIKGREAIWIEGKNDGRIIGHDSGPLGVVSVRLLPESALAMRGNRYPISEFGIETLIVRMLERGATSQRAGRCDVEIKRNASINGRKCTMMIFKHSDRSDKYQFHIVHIFVDDELNVPIRYAMYSWPEQQGGKPVLEEEYTYTDIKINVGLKDEDFDPGNAEYDFPGSMLTL